MQKDLRPSFAEAKERLRRFLLEQRWSSRCVWLPEAKVRRKRKRVWLFRPERDSDEQAAEVLYSEIFATGSSIKLIGIAQETERTFILIERYRGDPGHFYMSLVRRVPEIVVVRSRLRWFLLPFDRGVRDGF